MRKKKEYVGLEFHGWVVVEEVPKTWRHNTRKFILSKGDQTKSLWLGELNNSPKSLTIKKENEEPKVEKKSSISRTPIGVLNTLIHIRDKEKTKTKKFSKLANFAGSVKNYIIRIVIVINNLKKIFQSTKKIQNYDANKRIIDFLYSCLVPTWKSRIEYGVKNNLPIGLDFGDTDFEALSCEFYGIKGTGKNSGDNDHHNGDETKGANKIRAKTCECGQVSNFFQKTCECGSKQFKYADNQEKTDVRWGIDTNAHFKYGVPNYHLWILEAEEYRAENRVFFLKLFTISSKNRMFNDILKVQNNANSKSKNFVPYSKDFYASNPKMMVKLKITLSEKWKKTKITSEEIEEIFITKGMLEDKRHISRYIPDSFVPTKDTYLYEEIESLLNVNLYPTTHGKSRGTTNRRSEQNL